MNISFTSEIAEKYSRELSKVSSLDHLDRLLRDYKPLVSDAIEAAPKSEDEFQVFLTGLKKERKGKFAGEAFAEKYSAVIMPEILFRVSITALQYGVPWGCAFIRMKEAGLIKNYNNGNGYFMAETA